MERSPGDMVKVDFEPDTDDPTTAVSRVPMMTILLPLINDDWTPKWRQHKRYGGRVDVAVLPIDDLTERAFLLSWSLDEAHNVPPGDLLPIQWPQLGAGDDVFIVGYPYSLTSALSLPLWIRGTVASDPMFGFAWAGEEMPLFLIDARSREGQSGSAVLRRMPAGRMLMRPDGKPGMTVGISSRIEGVYSGRINDESDLGFVWPMRVVDAICGDGAPGDGVF